MSATTAMSLDGLHATPTARRKDELARAFFDAVNAGEQTRIDELFNLDATSTSSGSKTSTTRSGSTQVATRSTSSIASPVRRGRN
jgi:hypothetical protein